MSKSAARTKNFKFAVKYNIVFYRKYCPDQSLFRSHPSVSRPNINSFPSKSFSEYDEIWILSGGSNNSDDLRIDSAAFQRFLQGILNSSANLFLGTGDGSVYHTNAITSALGFGNLVSPSGGNARIAIYPANNDISIVTEITKNQMRTNDPLFANVDVLPDTVISKTNLDSLITSSKGEVETARVSIGKRQIILEAGLGRIYNIWNNDRNTRNYVINLMTTLRK